MGLSPTSQSQPASSTSCPASRSCQSIHSAHARSVGSNAGQDPLFTSLRPVAAQGTGSGVVHLPPAHRARSADTLRDQTTTQPGRSTHESDPSADPASTTKTSTANCSGWARSSSARRPRRQAQPRTARRPHPLGYVLVAPSLTETVRAASCGTAAMADDPVKGGRALRAYPCPCPVPSLLTPSERTRNRALAAARAPVERGVARLKSWRIFRRSRCSPNRMTPIAKAVLTLERQR